MNLRYLPTLDEGKLEEIEFDFITLGFKYFPWNNLFDISPCVQTPSGMILIESHISEYFKHRRLEFGNPVQIETMMAEEFLLISEYSWNPDFPRDN